MLANRRNIVFSLVALTVMIVMLSVSAVASAAPEPTKFLFSRHIGFKVDETTGGNICTLASGDTCKPGAEGGEPGEFSTPQGIAVSRETGDVYVADSVNFRVQELTPEGQFVSMFGWEVNKTKVEAKASQAEQNVCTAASKDVCQAGVAGAAPGQLGVGATKSIAVDPTGGGGVYVAEVFFGEVGGEFAIGQRVQKFTAAGQWVLEIGKEVNETTKGNLCTLAEEEKAAVKCQGPALQTPAAAQAVSEPGAFNFEAESGGLLTVGGPQDLLYVGDQGRVQEFKATGEPAGKVSLTALSSTSKASGVAVNPAGELFVVEEYTGGVRVYNPKGELRSTVIDPAAGKIEALALDALGRPVLIEGGTHGVLYTPAGVKLSLFAPPSGEMAGAVALAAGPSGELYVVDVSGQEVEAYTPAVFPLAGTCAASEVAATSARLCGEVDPNELPTIGVFDYGTSQGSLTSSTAMVFSGEGSAFTAISAPVTGLVPNQTYYYQTVGEGKLGGEARVADGEELSFQTSIAPPLILGEPSASFITRETAVLGGAVDPEHTATTYRFEYGPCATLAACGQVSATTGQQSAQYGELGVIQEAHGLLPGTTYRYRLAVENEAHQSAVGPEQSFTTSVGAMASASTGLASAVTSTGAVISGTVDPDGEPASYVFELGVYEGAATRYGVVLSASAGVGSSPVGESLALTGLQPGTTYAYRIAIAGGHSQATGATVLFSTQGQSSLLTAPAVTPLLAIPTIAFPTTTTTIPKAGGHPPTALKCKRGYVERKIKGKRRCVKTPRQKPRKSARKHQ
jgi:DNA-binding beta-propeller fold protein YncE